ncbi:MAG: DUF4097 domain-containing protein [Ruminococcaceae bacterium]|nr:DUF4097 domain-containing protein [Oscillospiraceae bacterium]
MKKTSIVFIVISILLIISGLIIQAVAMAKAENDNVTLFKQILNKNGDLVESVAFPWESTNKINISLDDTDINIIGNSDRCYAEIVNFSSLEYIAYSSNRAFTIEEDIISSIVGRAQSGDFKFEGIRNFFRFDKHNSKKVINIYLSPKATLKVLDIKINNGNISVKDINLVCDFDITVNNGNITFENTPNVSLIKTNTKNGNISLNNMFVSAAELSVENGNIDFSTSEEHVYNYSIESETGKIKHNDTVHKGKFDQENENNTGVFKAHVGVGDVTIKTIKKDN